MGTKSRTAKGLEIYLLRMTASYAGALNGTSVGIFANRAEGRVNSDHLKYYQLANRRINARHTQRFVLKSKALTEIT